MVLIAESEAPLAEGEGFKPPIPEKGIPDFESSAIVHSANLPKITKPSSFADAKVTQKPDTTKRIVGNLRKLFESEFFQAVSQLFSLALADT